MQARIYNYQTWVEETDPIRLKEQFETLLIKSGFGILQSVEHHFEPFGYTCLFLLSESHFAIHTFPEENTTYIELSSCVKKQFDIFIQRLNNDAKT